LSKYINVPRVYPAGRLDRDSEGLMVLTDNGALQSKISDPKNKMTKTYWVQVEGTPSGASLAKLNNGVLLKDGKTAPANVQQIDEPDGLWERDPPVRFRVSVSDTWISITIAEGRNRQVRRMTAAIGHPTLRLIRAQIGEWKLGDLALGKWTDA
jgi:23S rRNA pseudouridine2457 synthase